MKKHLKKNQHLKKIEFGLCFINKSDWVIEYCEKL